jgi:predicted acyl esterase
MIGDSYWSWSQYFAAASQPPHLKCICQCDGTTDLYRDAVYPGGIFNAAFMNQWIAYHAAMAAWPGPVAGKEPPMNLHWEIVNRPYDSAWWQERSARTYLDRIKVPVMSIAPQGGQMHFRGQLAGYPEIASPKKLLVVPPTGFLSHLRYLTNPELNAQMLRWFDHWLKGKDTGIMDEPEVAIFDSGTRVWRHESEYPLKRTRWSKLYLNGGALGETLPPDGETSDTYRLPDSYAQLIAGKPVLSYQTQPLDTPLKLGGPISFTLYASSSQIDTLWFVNVLDVAPDGNAVPLSRGMLRASFREVDEDKSKPGQPWHPFTRMQPLEPGEVYEFQIELRPLFHTFKAGHCLRLTLASEDIQFNNPLRQIDVQLLPWPVENAVHRSARYPSHLVLPVIPEAAETHPVGAPIREIDWPAVPGQWMPDTDGYPLRAARSP